MTQENLGPLIGAIDEGTSSARFILFRLGTNEIVASHQQSLSQQYPKEGWVEQDPMEILGVVHTCIEKTMQQLSQLGGSRENVLAIGITNQRESTIVWDKETGIPLHNSIVWLDMRTTSTIEQLLDSIPNKSKNKDYLKPLCGLPLSPYFSAVKLRWLRENIASIKHAMNSGQCLFGTVDTWLLWNLTGRQAHKTDVSNASRTMLMNIETLKWDRKLLDFFGLPVGILPEICSSSEIYGYMSEGPLQGVPLAGCLGDQQAALLGQMCLERGQAKCTYGTGCFLLYNTGTRVVDSSHGLLTTVAYKIGPDAPPIYALEGSVAVAGAALTWLRDNINLVSNVSDVEPIAKSALNNNTDICFVPAFSGLYAPYWQQDARGVICGITDDTSSADIVRATLEAVCFQIRDVVEAMNKDSGSNLSVLKVDGGMTTNNLLMQMQSNLLGLPVERPVMTETTALGAAIAAGAAVNQWDLGMLKIKNAVTSFAPQQNEDERDLRYSRWKLAIERSMGWA